MLESAIAWFLHYKYAAIFVATLFQGPPVMLSSGFALHFGTFDLVPLFLTLMFADLFADTLWYTLGRFGTTATERIGKFFRLNPEKFEHYKAGFRKHHTKILVISKLTNGFGAGVVVLIAAGAARVPIARYAVLMLLGGTVWTATLIAVGYLFGNVYQTLPEDIRIAATVFILICAGGLVYYISSRLRKYDAS